jgi:glycine C-acetyltransferase
MAAPKKGNRAGESRVLGVPTRRCGRVAILTGMYEGASEVYATALGDIRAAGLEKSERQLLGAQGASIRVGEAPEPVLNFCANNYLGLSSHPRVLDAARAALDTYGYGLSSVRFICGTQDAHKRLESAVAGFLGMEDAILYSSCFDANGGLFETLLDERDAIVSDELNHASIIDGIRLCRAERLRYPHGDMAALEAALERTRGKRLRMIATDGVFSMDGDLAPLARICDLADRYRALVMVDDSHATGFVGKTGRGTIEHCEVMGRVDIVTSTLGKALGGAAGGFTASRREVVALLRQRSRPYLFSNSLAPAIVGASLAVLEMLQSTEASAPRLAEQVIANARRFRDGMAAAGFRIRPGFHPIAPVMMSGPRALDENAGGDARLAQDVAAAMLAEGIYVIGFSYPVVPRGQARIRVQLSAAHTAAMIDRAIDAFTRVGKRFELI